MSKYFIFLFIFFIVFIFSQAIAQPIKSDYWKIIQESVNYNWDECYTIIDHWKLNIQKSNLFGYSTTSYPANFAELLGFMYQETGDEKYVAKGVEMLLSYEDLKKIFPKEFYEDRIEYAKGLPPISDFFSMYSYPKAYLYLKKSDSISKKDRQIIERGIADCANFLMNYPEWGPMNRAILRSETFYYAYLGLPEHPDAPKWQRMAKILSSDSYQNWEEEDAAGYHPVWMLSLMRMVDLTQDKYFYRSAIPRYYFDYFANLITPGGLIADFGDARWPSDWYRWIPIFEKGAAVYKEPIYKWAVGQYWQYIQENKLDPRGAYTALAFVDAYKWADESIQSEPLKPESRLVMEEIVGKKALFRNGTDRNSTFFLLNYQDEGNGAYAGREFLRTTIPVEEEKMHHGNSDENSIAMLWYDGSILLNDCGYRDALPSGEYGRFRADYYHNRIVVRKNKRWIQIEGERKEQSLWEFIRNSGAYRPVHTNLINFIKFDHVDYSRTRLIDDEMGYEWDRVVIYHKIDQFFVVVDVIKSLREDYFTYSNLWHTRKIVNQSKDWFDTAYDSVGSYVNKSGNNLLIYFPVKEYVRSTGLFYLKRHWQDEICMYETLSDHYYAGNMEIFVTILFPHDSRTDPASIERRFELIETDKFPSAIGLKYTHDGRTEYFGIKGDLQMDYIQQNIRPRYSYDLGKVAYGPFQTDGNLFFASIEGNKLQWACSNMTKVLYEDRILHESLNTSFNLQLDSGPTRSGRTKWRYWEETISLGK